MERPPRPGRSVPGRLRRYWEYRLTTGWRIGPLRGAIIYLGLGFAGLYVSDVLFVRHFSEPFLSQLQAVKAGIEVLLTAVFVYVILYVSRYPPERSRRTARRRQEGLQVLHRVLRHNLRNDVDVVLGFTDLLQRAAPRTIASTARRYGGQPPTS